MNLRVLKFGGTSVANPKSLLDVARFLTGEVRCGDRLVVVVSAMGKMTDQLTAQAYEVSPEPPRREMDMLLSAGERISMALLSMALHQHGVRALSLTGSQAGIVTTAHHQKARIRRVLGDRIRKGIEEQKVVIVAGFQGVSEAKEITTLGRGGSDTTAVALAAALGVSRCEIFTDVPGVLNAPPQVIPKAALIPKLDLETGLLMADSGASVLHPRSVQLAQHYGITVAVKRSPHLGKTRTGTELQGQALDKGSRKLGDVASNDLETTEVIGVNVETDWVPIQVEMTRASLASTFFDSIDDKDLSLKSSRIVGGMVIGLIATHEQGVWKSLLESMIEQEFIRCYSFREDAKIITLCLNGLAYESSVLKRSLNILASKDLFPRELWSEGKKVSFEIPDTQVNDCIQILHETWLK